MLCKTVILLLSIFHLNTLQNNRKRLGSLEYKHFLFFLETKVKGIVYLSRKVPSGYKNAFTGPPPQSSLVSEVKWS